MGQLDDNFIPISDEEVVKLCNLGEKYTKSEQVEAEFVFYRKLPTRLMFKKKINDYQYFESFVKPSGGYDLYEITFGPNDRRSGNLRLALLTKLRLNEESFSVEIQNHFNEATLRLVKQEVKLSVDELDRVDRFTVSIFRVAIPAFAMSSEDPKFDSESCLFKFVVIDRAGSIDYDRMHQVLFELNADQLDSGETEKLVRSIHTDDQFKLITSSSYMRPSNTYDGTHGLAFIRKGVSFTEFYSKAYGIAIENEKKDLLQVERYSSVGKSRKDGDQRSKYDYLPKELCVISTISDPLRMVCCLPRMIYELKKRIILNHIRATLNAQILKINNDAFETPIFTRIVDSNIAEYISENNFKDNLQAPADDGSSNGTSSSGDASSKSDESEDEETLVWETNEAIDRELDEAQKRQRSTITQNPKKLQVIRSKENVFYSPPDPHQLDKFQDQSMNAILKSFGFSNLDDFLNEFNFEQLFNSIVNRELAVAEDTQESDRALQCQAVEQLPESDELKDIDFNFWTNESSDQQIVDERLLREALTMDDSEKLIDRERLEFFGDAFLKFVTCCLLFHLHRDALVGNLDILKTNAVMNKNLYLISRRFQISQVMFFGEFVPGRSWLPEGFSSRPDPKRVAQNGKSETPVTLVDSDGFHLATLGSVDRCQYHTLKPKCLSDGIEALIGKSLF